MKKLFLMVAVALLSFVVVGCDRVMVVNQNVDCDCNCPPMATPTPSPSPVLATVDVTLSATSPSGGAIPGNNEIARFILANYGQEDVEVISVTFSIAATDLGGNGWQQEVPITLYQNNMFVTPIGLGTVDIRAGVFTVNLNEPLLVRFGSSVSLILKADTSGASSAHDDWLKAALEGVAGHIVGNQNSALGMSPVRLEGHTIIY